MYVSTIRSSPEIPYFRSTQYVIFCVLKCSKILDNLRHLDLLKAFDNSKMDKNRPNHLISNHVSREDPWFLYNMIFRVGNARMNL